MPRLTGCYLAFDTRCGWVNFKPQTRIGRLHPGRQRDRALPEQFYQRLVRASHPMGPPAKAAARLDCRRALATVRCVESCVETGALYRSLAYPKIPVICKSPVRSFRVTCVTKGNLRVAP